MDGTNNPVWKGKVDKIIDKLGKIKNAILPCLEAVQQEVSYIPQEAITYLRRKLNVPAIDIYGVITFYGMLTIAKQGKYIIRVCNSLPCYLNGFQTIIKVLKDELKIKNGETTSDGKFTLEETACLGLCDKAPAMIINDGVYGNLTEKKVRNIIKEFSI